MYLSEVTAREQYDGDGRDDYYNERRARQAEFHTSPGSLRGEL